MDIKKLLIGGFAAGVILFLLGWIFYGQLAMSYMHHNPGRKGHLDRQGVFMYYVFLGSLLRGFLLAFVFIKANVNSLIDGLITGLVIGFLMIAGADILTYGTTLIMSKKGIAADIACFTAMTAITGAVLGLLLGKLKK